MKRKFFKRAAAAAAAAVCMTAIASAIPMGASAGWTKIGVMGDLNGDGESNAADLVLLSKHIMGANELGIDSGYYINYAYYSINGSEADDSLEYIPTADINSDGRVDIFDLMLLRQNVVFQWGAPVYIWTSEPADDFIDPPIYDLYGSMPSQGTAKIAVFYVDFPDCRYSYEPSLDDIRSCVFDEYNPNDENYPYDSINSFYSRASKGALTVDGEVFRYTTKQQKSYYEGDAWHVKLMEEILTQLDGSIDFSQFDGDGNGEIDTILISVPEAAGDDDWWPAAGQYGSWSENRADGMNIGHLIVGNAEIKPGGDHSNFCSSYIHEMGHCMGLPDYYLYNADDFQGMHGSAGFEMMDDAVGDFGAASKLMLGWYREDQISVYDSSAGAQTFKLGNAQTNDGSCIIIPKGNLADKYRSEFMIIEYTTLDNNNSELESYWWMKTGSGVRIYHVQAEVTGDYWYNSFKYASGEDEATNYNQGIRFIRLVGEGDNNTDNLFRAGESVNSSVGGFRWYDQNGGETVDTGIKINIGALEDDVYTVTISAA